MRAIGIILAGGNNNRYQTKGQLQQCLLPEATEA